MGTPAFDLSFLVLARPSLVALLILALAFLALAMYRRRASSQGGFSPPASHSLAPRSSPRAQFSTAPSTDGSSSKRVPKPTCLIPFEPTNHHIPVDNLSTTYLQSFQRSFSRLPVPIPLPAVANSVMGRPLTLSSLRNHRVKLMQPFHSSTTGFDIEFNEIGFHDVTYNQRRSYSEALGFVGLNRYADVNPYDDNRVRLLDGHYINASWITMDNPNEPEYIATQGPLPQTCNDFWRMVWQTNSRNIVALTNERETNYKCSDYWTFRSIDLRKGLTVVAQGIDEDGQTATRVFEMRDAHTGETRQVTQYHYLGWPDRDTPTMTGEILKLAQNLDRPAHEGPIIIHCSAGIGRTGTFCTIHSTIKAIDRYKAQNGSAGSMPVNLMQTVAHLRSQRMGMVQNPAQYQFAHKAIEDYLSGV